MLLLLSILWTLPLFPFRSKLNCFVFSFIFSSLGRYFFFIFIVFFVPVRGSLCSSNFSSFYICLVFPFNIRIFTMFSIFSCFNISLVCAHAKYLREWATIRKLHELLVISQLRITVGRVPITDDNSGLTFIS